jgi:hypothetical protein
MLNMKKYILGLISASLLIASCQKKVDPVDTFNVTVEYRNGGAKYVTGDVNVNPKDSIYFDVTITAPEDMSFVEIQKNFGRLDTFRLDNASNKRTFSFVKGYRADSIPGDYTFRVLARNNRAIFIGDGGKQFKVTVSPDFLFWSDRIMRVPDTTDKTNKAYYSIAQGKTYSYTEGNTNSALIDFGYFWDTTGRGTSSTADDLKHTIYALNALQNQLAYYDISSWTKNATVFKRLSVNFVSGLTSSGAIQTLVGNQMSSGTSTKIDKLVKDNVIGFKTAAGKFGAILIRRVSAESPEKTTEMEIDVKVQK